MGKKKTGTSLLHSDNGHISDSGLNANYFGGQKREW